MPAPTIVQAKAAITPAAANNLAITLDSVPVAGNLMIWSWASGSNVDPNVPSGWTYLGYYNGGSPYLHVFYKIAGSSESQTKTHTWGGNLIVGAGFFEVSGQPAVWALGQAVNRTTATTSVTTPSVTVPDNTLLLGLGHCLWNQSQSVGASWTKNAEALHGTATSGGHNIQSRSVMAGTYAASMSSGIGTGRSLLMVAVGGAVSTGGARSQAIITG
jgi:hypothetical protein